MSSAGFAHHGGRLGAARAAYSHAPQPWIDLSTGINPKSYPAPRARGSTLNRLPDTGELSRLDAPGSRDRLAVQGVLDVAVARQLVGLLAVLTASLISPRPAGSSYDQTTRPFLTMNARRCLDSPAYRKSC